MPSTFQGAEEPKDKIYPNVKSYFKTYVGYNTSTYANTGTTNKIKKAFFLCAQKNLNFH